MGLSEHNRKQLAYVAGGSAVVLGYLWWRGKQGGGISLAPLPPVSGGYINTDNGASSPLNQPVANRCPPGYLPIPGNACQTGFFISNWGGFAGAPNLSVYGATPGPFSAPSSTGVNVIAGGSTTLPSCTSAGCR